MTKSRVRLILLASYSNNDISDQSVKVLSIRGSNDLLTTKEEVENSKDMLPIDADFQIISGGNHANFGYYGVQDGDGTPTITREEQHQETVSLISNFIDSTANTVTDFAPRAHSGLYNFFFIPRDIENGLSSRQYFTLIILNVLTALIPIGILFLAFRVYYNTEEFRKELRPILVIISFVLISRILPTINRSVGLWTGGTREFVINQIQANILPFVFIFNSFATLLLVYVRVPVRRKARFDWTIRLARIIAVVTLIVTIGFFFFGAITQNEGLSRVLNFYAYLIFMLIVILLLLIIRILTIEKEASIVKLNKMKLDIFRYSAIFTWFYLISAIIITFIIIFNPNTISFYGSAIILSLYSGLNGTVLAILSFWIVNAPTWLKERYGMTVPKTLEM